MLETTPSASARYIHTRSDKNGLDTDGDSNASNGGIKNLSTIEKLAKSKKLDFA